LEGKFGKDITGMMSSLKNLQEKTSVLGKAATESLPKQMKSQLASYESDD